MRVPSFSGPRQLLCSLVWLGLAFSQPEPLRASSFSVNPVQIFLSATATSRLLTLRNASDQVLRFQVTAMKWDQSPQGEMQLTPTKDIVFFPTLLALGPKEQRNVRIGAVTSFAPTEKTYRLFVEQLPPTEATEPQRQGITVLTKMGIPIFLQPSKPAPKASLQELRAGGGAFSFRLLNTGTAHFMPRTIRLRLFGEAGELITTREEKGWYVLAGGVRDYDVKLPPSDCERIRAVTVEVQIDALVLTDKVDVAPSTCSLPPDSSRDPTD